MGKLGDWFKKKQEEVDTAIADKLMDEQLNPTLRKHRGEPIKPPKKDEGKK